MLFEAREAHACCVAVGDVEIGCYQVPVNLAVGQLQIIEGLQHGQIQICGPAASESYIGTWQ